MQDTNFYIEIPIKPYIKKYLEQNPFLKRPFQLTSTDPVGIVLMNLIEPAPKNYHPRKITEYTIKAYNFEKNINTTSFIQVNILEHYSRIKKPKFYISDTGINTFNSYVDKLIKIELYHYVESLLQHGKRVRTLINDFIAKYDFKEDELTFHSLEKSYYRWKKSVQNIDIQ